MVIETNQLVNSTNFHSKIKYKLVYSILIVEIKSFMLIFNITQSILSFFPFVCSLVGIFLKECIKQCDV